ncbi:hypothetical protein OHB41_46270 [Streptomyces sp. NBC_01571]|uniref:hypothetical protein n=1 Tax=Streptomyces sp. NBC_01571 TaxID=2975883 RepID=UPI002258993D|nr:hypothetical protein [Streptomyces sp. NBC_01571]MCX4580441.1 hypothetical protein [Streptomyces sp. NBC_01571]
MKQQLAPEKQLTTFLPRTTVELSIEVENPRPEQGGGRRCHGGAHASAARPIFARRSGEPSHAR